MNIEIIAGAVALALLFIGINYRSSDPMLIRRKASHFLSFLKGLFPDNKSLDTTLLMGCTFVSIWMLLITDAAGVLEGEIVKDVMHLLTNHCDSYCRLYNRQESRGGW